MEEWYESSNSVDVDDTFYDQYSYTGMDGWEGPEYIMLDNIERDWPGRRIRTPQDLQKKGK